MAEEKKESGQFEGHGEPSTVPAGIQSPGTFVPLATEPTSVNQKSESGKKGEVK